MFNLFDSGVRVFYVLKRWYFYLFYFSSLGNYGTPPSFLKNLRVLYTLFN